ncbi:MAG: sigma-70 family RNA polymerase sigma factor [Planctomycetes bacterium]|nr:sigma-70 family RNA polymerase sigma factor [Planctomycetota bacterium]
MTLDAWSHDLEAALGHDHAWLRRLALRLVRDESRADDLLQETWLRVLRARPTDVRGARGWLATVLRRVAHDERRGDARRHAREEHAARAEPRAATDDVVADLEVQRRLLDAVMELEPPVREAVVLRYWASLPPREIARRQGAPVPTVKSRLARGLAQLRGKLAGTQDGRASWCLALARFALPAQPSAGGGLAAAAAVAVLVVAGGAWWSLHDGGASARTEAVAGGPPTSEVSRREPLPVLPDAAGVASARVAPEAPQDVVNGRAVADGATGSTARASTGAARRAGAPSDDPAPPGTVLVRGGRTQVGTPFEEIVRLLEEHAELVKSAGGFLAETPRHVVDVADFYLMVSEVTNEQYRAYVVATGARPPLPWGQPAIDAARAEFLTADAERRRAARAEGRDPGERQVFEPDAWWAQHWNEAAWEMPAHDATMPVTYVDHQDARAYAEWAGLRLMSEQEYERACRGDTARRYPWGDAIDERARAATNELGGAVDVHASGSFPAGASAEGVMDLTGNVWEWTDSPYVAYPGWKHRKIALGAGDGRKEIDTPPAWSAERRVVRGGSAQNSALYARCTTRGGCDRAMRASALGFRCAASVDGLRERVLSRIERLVERAEAVSPRSTSSDTEDWRWHAQVAIEFGREARTCLDPARAIGLRRWSTRDSDLQLPGYRVIDAYDEVWLLPQRSGKDLGSLSFSALLVSTVPLQEPRLAAGTYLVTFRGTTPPRVEFRTLDAPDLVATLEARDVSRGLEGTAGIESAEGVLRVSLFAADEDGSGLHARFDLELAEEARGGGWR